MAYEIMDNTGSVFPNNRRAKESHPNVTGSATIDGVQYFMDGWTKTTSDGRKWISFSFKKKHKQHPTESAEDSSSNDIPF